MFQKQPPREFNAKIRSGRERSDKILTVGLGEDAVTIQIELEGHCVSAMLDTGARPNVMDYNTLQKINLNQNMIDHPGQVFDVYNKGIRILGCYV